GRRDRRGRSCQQPEGARRGARRSDVRIPVRPRRPAAPAGAARTIQTGVLQPVAGTRPATRPVRGAQAAGAHARPRHRHPPRPQAGAVRGRQGGDRRRRDPRRPDPVHARPHRPGVAGRQHVAAFGRRLRRRRRAVPRARPGPGVRGRRHRQLSRPGLDGQAGAPGRPAGRSGGEEHRRRTARRTGRPRLQDRAGLHRRFARRRPAGLSQRIAHLHVTELTHAALAQAAVRGPLPQGLPLSSLGPFPMSAVLVAAAGLLAWWLVRVLARRMGGAVDASVPKLAAALFTDAFFVGLLAARLGYVLRWWPEYAASPWSVIAIGDGGFLWWTGLPAALVFAWWRTRRQTRLRKPLLAGLVAGLLAWLALGGMLSLLQRAAPPLPDVAAATLDGT